MECRGTSGLAAHREERPLGLLEQRPLGFALGRRRAAELHHAERDRGANHRAMTKKGLPRGYERRILVVLLGDPCLHDFALLVFVPLGPDARRGAPTGACSL